MALAFVISFNFQFSRVRASTGACQAGPMLAASVSVLYNPAINCQPGFPERLVEQVLIRMLSHNMDAE